MTACKASRGEQFRHPSLAQLKQPAEQQWSGSVFLQDPVGLGRALAPADYAAFRVRAVGIDAIRRQCRRVGDRQVPRDVHNDDRMGITGLIEIIARRVVIGSVQGDLYDIG